MCDILTLNNHRYTCIAYTLNNMRQQLIRRVSDIESIKYDICKALIEKRTIISIPVTKNYNRNKTNIFFQNQLGALR